MPDTEQRLRAAGLRVTQPRLAVLAVLDRAGAEGAHLRVAELAMRVREILGKVSTQAVYDCLEALTAAGVVRRVELPGSAALFETRVGDNHHHLVCRSCGRVVDVDCAPASAPCLHPSDPHGFAVAEAEVVFWGECAACVAGLTPAGRRPPSRPTGPSAGPVRPGPSAAGRPGR
ncbi:Fur family transcriptional regulator [Nocardioides sp. SYSU DS0651]|uniref:Fur family transcriptional regulator n=1 Tax=Nocardioides sp. SYSU DS0651 TaxID=3415955 RepID=UPI003F4BC200